jgi:hypothetical protein
MLVTPLTAPVADASYFVGFLETPLVASDLADGTKSHAGFYLFPGFGTDPQKWHARTCDGTTATNVATGLGPDVAADTAYRLRVELFGSATGFGSLANFYVNGSLASTSTTLPLDGDFLYVVFQAQGTAAVLRQLSVASCRYGYKLLSAAEFV